MVQPKKGFEPSEVYAAVAMFYTATELKKIKMDLYSVIDFITDSESKLTNAEGGVVFGSGQEKDAFESYFTWQPTAKKPFPEPWQVNNMAQGISGALAIKDWLAKENKGTEAETVYMTGKQWPQQVEIFNINVRGFSSYNSSDIIIKPKGNPKSFMGVSLKKKPTIDSVDPTMINKAFDTVLGTDRSFQTMKQEVVKARAEYFGGKVKEAVSEGLINFKVSGRTNEWLFSGHGTLDRDIHNMESKRAIIDTKGSLKMDEILSKKNFTPAQVKQYGKKLEDLYGLATENKSELLQMLDDKKVIKPTTIPKSDWNFYGDKALGKSELSSNIAKDSMRRWVNNKLATDKTLYDLMLEKMDANAEKVAEQLISVTLRTDVLKEIKKRLKARRLGDIDFGFALVTGLGKTPSKIPTAMKIKTQEKEMKKSVLDVPIGKVYDVPCVLQGLAHLDTQANGKKDYRFVVKQKEEPHVDDDGPAKLIFDLVKNNEPILAMELRFKGGFTGQPQFQGYMTDEFKKVLAGECL